MTVKAKLKIQLFAGEVLVAQSEDAVLWQQILAEISGHTATHPKPLGPEPLGSTPAAPEAPGEDRSQTGRSGDHTDDVITRFAAQLNVSVEFIKGACDPTTDAPYIHLDHQCYEALKKNTPSRGTKSVAPAVLSGTLACLWDKHASIGNINLQTISDILKTIDLRDQNPGRSLKNCAWLQVRSGKIVLNPAEITQAINTARAYALKQKIEEA